MSRHHLHTVRSGRPWLVVVGYDRPLNEFFLQLWDDTPGADAEEPAYSSLHEAVADWRDIATVLRRLGELGTEVPRSMIDAVVPDGAPETESSSTRRTAARRRFRTEALIEACGRSGVYAPGPSHDDLSIREAPGSSTHSESRRAYCRASAV